MTSVKVFQQTNKETNKHTCTGQKQYIPAVATGGIKTGNGAELGFFY